VGRRVAVTTTGAKVVVSLEAACACAVDWLAVNSTMHIALQCAKRCEKFMVITVKNVNRGF
jgi:hypothetical protein